MPGRAEAGDLHGAYVFADSEASANYVPDQRYQHNSLGAAITINRTALGTYEVNVPHPSTAVDSDTVQVTAFGSSGAQCLVTSWWREAAETKVYVSCFDGRGARADSKFTLSYLTPSAAIP